MSTGVAYWWALGSGPLFYSAPETTVPATPFTGPPVVPPDNASASVQALPDDRFVDCNAGSDRAKGDVGAPWRSPAALAGYRLPAGATVYLARGCRWTGAVELNGAGTKDRPVRLSAYGGGPAPVLSGPDLALRTAVLTIRAPYASVDQIHISGAPGFGVEVLAPHATLDRITVDGVGIGVRFGEPFGVLQDSTLQDLHMMVNTPGGDDDFGAMGVAIEADDTVVERTSCIRCRARSYDYGHDGGFADIFNTGNRVRLIDNYAEDVDSFLEVGGVDKGTAFDVVIQGNTARGVSTGIGLHVNDPYAIPGSMHIVGNTIIGADDSRDPLFYGALWEMTLENNVIVTSGRVTGRSGGPKFHAGNAYYLTSPSLLGFRLGNADKVHPHADAPTR